MRIASGFSIAMAAMFVHQIAWGNWGASGNIPDDNSATERRMPAEGGRPIDAGAGRSERTPEARNNNNANLWGGNARPNAPMGSSGIEQPRSAENLERVPMLRADGQPVKNDDGSQKTKAVVPKGYFIESTPFRPTENPAGQGFTRHQVTGRFSDFSKSAQQGIRTELVAKRDKLADQKSDTTKLDSVIAALDSNPGSVYIDKGVMDVSDSANGEVRVQSVGDVGIVDNNAGAGVAVAAAPAAGWW
jgi:hypothetical protein